MKTIGAHARLDQLRPQGIGDGDHTVEATKYLELEPLEQVRQPAHATRSVQRAHGGDPEPPCGEAVQDVRSIAVCVEDVRPARAQVLPDLAPFLQVAPPVNRDLLGLHACLHQRLEERGRIRRRVDDRDHRHRVPPGLLPQGQAVDDPLQPSDPGGSAQVHDGKGPRPVGLPLAWGVLHGRGSIGEPQVGLTATAERRCSATPSRALTLCRGFGLRRWSIQASKRDASSNSRSRNPWFSIISRNRREV